MKFFWVAEKQTGKKATTQHPGTELPASCPVSDIASANQLATQLPSQLPSYARPATQVASYPSVSHPATQLPSYSSNYPSQLVTYPVQLPIRLPS